MKVSAQYFDGRNSNAQAVAIEIGEDMITVKSGTHHQQYHLDELHIQDGLGASFVTIDLPRGGRLELLGIRSKKDLGLRSTSFLLRLLEDGPSGLILSISLLALGLYVVGTYVIPILANSVTPLVPEVIFNEVEKVTLASLDERFLKPSELSEERKKEVEIMLQRLSPGAGFSLAFRSLENAQANAFALPGNTIVVADGLINTASQEEISAVLAHELGHHSLRHVRIALVRLSLSSVLIGITTGDFSNTIGQLTTAIWHLGFSRNQEFAADEFAVQRLQASGMDGSALVSALEKIETQERNLKKFPQNSDAESGHKGYIEDFELLSTHPATNERAERIRAIASGAPPALH